MPDSAAFDAWLETQPPQHGLKPSVGYVDDIAAFQEQAKGRVVEWGIRFFDDSLGPLYSSDLAVVTADTGAGKTTLATLIAMNASRCDLRVAMFPLEAHEGEIEQRIVYTEVQRLAWQRQVEGRQRLDFGRWANGIAEPAINALNAEAKDTARQWLALQLMRYRRDRFTVNDIRHEFRAIGNDVDLLILDHAHFVDAGEDENKSIAEVANALRDVTVELGKPVVAVAHLRKRGVGASRALIPSVDDLHGSSTLAKVATRIIALAPAVDRMVAGSGFAPTYAKTLKDRWNGVKGFAGLLSFDLSRAAYAPTYKVGRFDRMGQRFDEFSRDEVPHWCSCPDAHSLPTMRG